MNQSMAENFIRSANPPQISAGDTAWMLTSTALVLLMTIPGLALFYGGMVRKKNVLATLMQSFAITCLVTVLWVIIGYSLAFMPGGPFIGSLDRLFLNGMLFQKEAGKLTVSHLALTIPESVYMMFQMTFAIITPALICGGFADRMKFSAMMWFMGIWSIVIYAPIAHMMWEPSGYWASAAVHRPPLAPLKAVVSQAPPSWAKLGRAWIALSDWPFSLGRPSVR